MENGHLCTHGRSKDPRELYLNYKVLIGYKQHSGGYKTRTRAQRQLPLALNRNQSSELNSCPPRRVLSVSDAASSSLCVTATLKCPPQRRASSRFLRVRGLQRHAARTPSDTLAGVVSRRCRARCDPSPASRLDSRCPERSALECPLPRWSFPASRYACGSASGTD